MELGPKDIEAGQAVLVRRDTHEKITVAIDEIPAKVGELLETIQHDMFERAKAHRDAHTYDAHSLEEMKTLPTTSRALSGPCGAAARNARIN